MGDKSGSSQRHQAWITAAREQVAAVQGIGGSSGNQPASGTPNRLSPSSRITDAPSLPGYQELVELHRGGQGVVYRGIQKSTGRTVAIKVMREGPFAGESDRLRFDREVAILAQLHHDHVVGILDRGVEAGCYYFVMDYVEGRPLDRYLREEEPGLEARLQLFATICETVSAAHFKGIIHRDLKPGNILVDDNGKPRILDFGLAKLTQSDGADSANTITGQFVGSLPWASPEQIGGKPEEIDTRTDVYSLGVIFYHLLTGAFPYRVVGPPRDVMENILSVDPEAPSRIAGRSAVNRIDADLDTIAKKSLQKDRNRRYQTAAELARDIRHYLSGEPIEARRDSGWYVFTKLAARHRAAAIIAAAFLILVTASSMISLGLWHQATEERDRALRVGELEASARHRADAEAAKAHAVSGFLEEMLTAANPENARNPDLTVKEALDAAAKKIDDGSLQDEPEVEIAVRQAIGNTYVGLGLYKEAAAQQRKALALAREGEAGPIVGDETIAGILCMLGESLAAAGEFEEAESILREALDLSRRLFGENHYNVGSCLNELAIIHKTIGDAKTAEAFYREALDVTRATVGPDSQEYCATLNNLAILIAGRGETAEAEQMMRTVLETRRRVLGDDHPDVAYSLAGLATLLHGMRRFDEADALARQALELRKRVLGDEHPAVATSLNNLAVMADEAGKYDEAVKYHEQALALRRKLLGPEHNETAVSLNNLARALHHAGQYERSVEMFNEALVLIRKSFGPTHGYVTGVMWNLSEVLEAMHDDEAAEKLLREMQELNLKIYGPEHPSFCNGQIRIATILNRTNRFTEAEPVLRECVAVREKILPPGTWTIASAKSLLGESLAGQGKFAEAEPLLLESSEAMQANTGVPLVRKKEAIDRIIRLYEDWGATDTEKLALARPWREQLARLDTP